jgi:hypothetical protein
VKDFIKSALCVAALCLTAGPLLAADGVLIVEKTTTNGASRTNQIQIEKSRMRVDSDRNGQPQILVFDGTAQVMRIINPMQKTYSEITKADVDRMAAQLQGAMAQMQEQLKNVPEAQRAQIEAMMRGRGLPGAAAPAKTEYRRTGTDKVGRWTCDKYEGYQNSQKVSELCTVDPRALGFTIADFEVSREMASFFQALVPQGSAQLFSIGGAGQQGYSGVPVRRTFTVAGIETTNELSDVTRQNFPDASYAVPAGFTKEDSPFAAAAAGRGRGRGRQ